MLVDEQKETKEENRATVIKFDEALKERMQFLVDDGQYSSLNELIRDGIRHIIEPQREKIDKELTKYPLMDKIKN